MVCLIYTVVLSLWVKLISQLVGYDAIITHVKAVHCLKLPKKDIRAFIALNHTHRPLEPRGYGIQPLYAVPKKKPSKRRTRIRKTAWMKRLPNNWKRPMMLDILDVTKYTDGTLTKSRTTRESWLNLPDTSLEGEHFLTTELRPRW